jgi:hypothetical protein
MAIAEATAARLFSTGYRVTALLLTNALDLANRRGIAAIARR